MMFQKKLDRAMAWLSEKSKSQGNVYKIDSEEFIDEDCKLEFYDPKKEWETEGNNLQLEKKDYLAIIISAFLVFSPVILVLILIVILLF